MKEGPAAFDGTWDLLISYRHTDLEFARKLTELLRQDYGAASFLDARAHTPGYDWREFWKRAVRSIPNALDASVGPGVLVLATAAMASEREAREDVVVQEIAEALKAERETSRVIPISVLVFDARGASEIAERVLKETGFQLDSLHQVRGLGTFPVRHPASISEDQWRTICGAAIRVSRASTLRRLREHCRDVLDWANDIELNRYAVEAGVPPRCSSSCQAYSRS